MLQIWCNFLNINENFYNWWIDQWSNFKVFCPFTHLKISFTFSFIPFNSLRKKTKWNWFVIVKKKSENRQSWMNTIWLFSFSQRLYKATHSNQQILHIYEFIQFLSVQILPLCFYFDCLHLWLGSAVLLSFEHLQILNKMNFFRSPKRHSFGKLKQKKLRVSF